ncbi:hypothetical protein SS50377_20504 [Spironucleus salmonicida]|uniref:Uncharacterized protein n=1 Tax=Spironucleus salmonicida TaxID=348837 RepID=V6LHM2_9EUKA|nr:hypothetical protein SS50377_20504 [Spironucleus salmonicida]|eukprot:EST43798.1 Hypothetical protein SS50377_16416 [Spironucleus salmonicida]
MYEIVVFQPITDQVQLTLETHTTFRDHKIVQMALRFDALQPLTTTEKTSTACEILTQLRPIGILLRYQIDGVAFTGSTSDLEEVLSKISPAPALGECGAYLDYPGLYAATISSPTKHFIYAAAVASGARKIAHFALETCEFDTGSAEVLRQIRGDFTCRAGQIHLPAPQRSRAYVAPRVAPRYVLSRRRAIPDAAAWFERCGASRELLSILAVNSLGLRELQVDLQRLYAFRAPTAYVKALFLTPCITAQKAAVERDVAALHSRYQRARRVYSGLLVGRADAQIEAAQTEIEEVVQVLQRTERALVDFEPRWSAIGGELQALLSFQFPDLAYDFQPSLPVSTDFVADFVAEFAENIEDVIARVRERSEVESLRLRVAEMLMKQTAITAFFAENESLVNRLLDILDNATLVCFAFGNCVEDAEVLAEAAAFNGSLLV